MFILVVRLFFHLDRLIDKKIVSSSNLHLVTFDRRKPLFIDHSGVDHLSEITEYDTEIFFCLTFYLIILIFY